MQSGICKNAKYFTQDIEKIKKAFLGAAWENTLKRGFWEKKVKIFPNPGNLFLGMFLGKTDGYLFLGEF